MGCIGEHQVGLVGAEVVIVELLRGTDELDRKCPASGKSVACEVKQIFSTYHMLSQVILRFLESRMLGKCLHCCPTYSVQASKFTSSKHTFHQIRLRNPNPKSL